MVVKRNRLAYIVCAKGASARQLIFRACIYHNIDLPHIRIPLNLYFRQTHKNNRRLDGCHKLLCLMLFRNRKNYMLVLNEEQINPWLPLTRELSAKLTEGEITTPPSKLRFATSPDKWRLFFHNLSQSFPQVAISA